jgi:hypothetical protein
VLDDLFAGLGARDHTVGLNGNLIRNVAYPDRDAADYPAQTFGRNSLTRLGNQFGGLAAINFA